jgi:hypothetical protein
VAVTVFARRSAVDSALQTGWSAAIERFTRAVHRYSDRIEMIPDRGLRIELRQIGAVLDAVLVDLRQAARGRHPRTVDGAEMVESLLQAAALCAQATDEALAAAAAARRGGQPADVARHVGAARGLAATVRELVDSCTTRQA